MMKILIIIFIFSNQVINKGSFKIIRKKNNIYIIQSMKKYKLHYNYDNKIIFSDLNFINFKNFI